MLTRCGKVTISSFANISRLEHYASIAPRLDANCLWKAPIVTGEIYFLRVVGMKQLSSAVRLRYRIEFSALCQDKPYRMGHYEDVN